MRGGNNQRNSNHRFKLFKYLIFGVAVIVTFMLNVGGTQDLHFRVKLPQVLYCRGHVQGREAAEGANKQTQSDNLKHLYDM